MVEVAPFRALEYDPDHADLQQVVSPPYDVIGHDLLERLRKASPHNIVHLTLHPDRWDRKKIDPFEAANELLESWIRGGILRTTDDEVVYAYECEYEHRGTPRRTRGVLCRLRLDPTYATVLPHEQIFPKPSEERVRILRATATDLEPIQLLYSGRSAEEALWAYVDGSQRAPDALAADPGGGIHRYWRISDAAIIGTVVDGFKGRKAYIADGHHRYAAAVKYAEERRTREYRPSRNAPWEHKFCLFVNFADPGLLILPTHRVVKRSTVKDPATLVKRWGAHFDVEEVALSGGNPVAELQRTIEAVPKGPVVGAWLGDASKGYVLTAKQPVVPPEALPDRGHTYRGLDVVFLQHLALAEGMRVPEARWGDDVAYTRDDGEAVAWIRKRKAVAVLLHRPTRMAQLRAVADSGQRMPQKSTYFLPKTLSGIAMYPIGKPGPVTRPRITS